MLQPDITKLMNPQWARFFDRIAQAQGQDASQPYNINLAGEVGRPSTDTTRYRAPHPSKRRPALDAMTDLYGVK